MLIVVPVMIKKHLFLKLKRVFVFKYRKVRHSNFELNIQNKKCV
jgi:hypothetical protein